MIDLTKFCDLGREHFKEPWSYGEHSFATDGRIAVRTQRDQSVSGKELHRININSIIQEAESKPRHDWATPPLAIGNTYKCARCKGEGCVYECAECNGLGELTFQTSFNTYNIECESCCGRGRMIRDAWLNTFGAFHNLIKFKLECDMCCGTGVIAEYDRVKIHGCTFAGKYISLIGELPAAQISVSEDSIGISLFRFDGGVGALMPIMPGYGE